MSDEQVSPRRRPHPAWHIVTAVLAAATALGVRQAMQPAGPIFSGTRTTPLVIRQSGSWVYPTGATVNLNAQQSQAQIAVDERASNTSVANLRTQGGFRGFSLRSIQNVTLQDCQSAGAGVAGSAHGSGGQGVYGDHGANLILRRLTVTRPAGHGLYLAEVWDGALIEDGQFTGQNEHSPLVQLNSGDVGPSGHIRNVTFRRGSYRVLDNSTPAFNFLGAGDPNQTILMDSVQVQGRVVVSNFAAPHPSYVTMQNCVVNGSVLVEGNSVLHVLGSTQITGQVTTKTGGKVVHN